MRRGLERDLGRWEEDLLSLDEVVARHGTEEVDPLLRVRSRLVALAEAPVPEPDWEGFSTVALAGTPVGRRPPVRKLVLALAATLSLGTGIAYAVAPEPLRAIFVHVRDGIESIFDADDSGVADERSSSSSTDGMTGSEEAPDPAESGGSGNQDDGTDDRERDRGEATDDEGAEEEVAGAGNEDQSQGEDQDEDAGDVQGDQEANEEDAQGGDGKDGQGQDETETGDTDDRSGEGAGQDQDGDAPDDGQDSGSAGDGEQ